MNNFDSKIANHGLTALVAAKSQQGERLDDGRDESSRWRWQFSKAKTTPLTVVLATATERQLTMNAVPSAQSRYLAARLFTDPSVCLRRSVEADDTRQWRHALRAQVKSTITYLSCVHFSKRPRWSVVLLLNVNFPDC